MAKNDLQRVIEKYLKRAKPGYQLSRILGKAYSRAIVIPAMCERQALPGTLHSLAANPANLLADTMVVIVVNNPVDADDQVIAENRDVLAWLGAGDETLNRLSLFTVDASSKGQALSRKGGVGAARRIGMDLVLHHLDWSNDPLLLCLDADTLVEETYIQAAANFMESHPERPAAAIDFEHQAGQTQEETDAIRCYEAFMQAYVDGLSKAGSPYAYHVLGSAIVCRAEAYVRCGGMRERNGGEDFYFMQALRKLGPIGQVTGTCVRPSARPSDRVPFGTGPRIRKLLDGEELRFYRPETFASLKMMLDVENAVAGEEFCRLPELLLACGDRDVVDFLTEYGFAEAWEKVYRNTPKNDGKLHEAFHTWFDAFRTLKFVHFCEERAGKSSNH